MAATKGPGAHFMPPDAVQAATRLELGTDRNCGRRVGAPEIVCFAVHQSYEHRGETGHSIQREGVEAGWCLARLAVNHDLYFFHRTFPVTTVSCRIRHRLTRTATKKFDDALVDNAPSSELRCTDRDAAS